MPYALLVDVDGAVRAARRSILESDGWEVEEAIDATVALAAMRIRPPDVVLLGLFGDAASGGIHLLQEMLLDPSLRLVPRVVISDGGSAVERRFALGLGAAAWLSSPVSPERLLAAAWDHRSDVTRDEAPGATWPVGPRGDAG